MVEKSINRLFGTYLAIGEYVCRLTVPHMIFSLLLTVAIDVTQPGGQTLTRSIADWKKRKFELGKRPAVFILGQSAF